MFTEQDRQRNSEKLDLPPAFPITGWVWMFPNHRPDCRASVLHAGHGQMCCVVGRPWQPVSKPLPPSLCSCPEGQHGREGGPAGAARAQRLLEVGMGFKGHPIAQKPALWLGLNVAAEDGSCEGAGGRSSAGWPHTFPSSLLLTHLLPPWRPFRREFSSHFGSCQETYD